MSPIRPAGIPRPQSDHDADILRHRPRHGAHRAAQGLLSIVIPCHNEEEVMILLTAAPAAIVSWAIATNDLALA